MTSGRTALWSDFSGIEKIYEKGYSTKPHNTGLGLWEVEKILKKHKNITRFTSKDNKLFKQQIEIYKS